MVRDNEHLNGSEWLGPTRIEKQTSVCVCVHAAYLEVGELGVIEDRVDVQGGAHH